MSGSRNRRHQTAWIGLVVAAMAYLFLSLRPSPEVGTLGVLPRFASLFLDEAMVYRNLWAFALLGLYAGLLLGVRAVPALRWPSILLTAAFLLAPSAKELLQSAFPPRDGNLWGASLGTIGIVAGLSAGNVLKWLFVSTRRRSPSPGRPTSEK